MDEEPLFETTVITIESFHVENFKKKTLESVTIIPVYSIIMFTLFTGKIMLYVSRIFRTKC